MADLNLSEQVFHSTITMLASRKIPDDLTDIQKHVEDPIRTSLLKEIATCRECIDFVAAGLLDLAWAAADRLGFGRVQKSWTTHIRELMNAKGMKPGKKSKSAEQEKMSPDSIQFQKDLIRAMRWLHDEIKPTDRPLKPLLEQWKTLTAAHPLTYHASQMLFVFLCNVGRVSTFSIRGNAELLECSEDVLIDAIERLEPVLLSMGYEPEIAHGMVMFHRKPAGSRGV